VHLLLDQLTLQHSSACEGTLTEQLKNLKKKPSDNNQIKRTY